MVISQRTEIGMFQSSEEWQEEQLDDLAEQNAELKRQIRNLKAELADLRAQFIPE